jgi:hypothetical protein
MRTDAKLWAESLGQAQGGAFDELRTAPVEAGSEFLVPFDKLRAHPSYDRRCPSWEEAA